MFLHDYDPAHGVVVCRACRCCIVPTRSGQERHLRAAPHRLLGEGLKAAVRMLGDYRLKTLEELRDDTPRRGDRCAAIQGLARQLGFCCLHAECAYCTRHLPKMKEHVSSAHKARAAEQARRAHCGGGPRYGRISWGTAASITSWSLKVVKVVVRMGMVGIVSQLSVS
jgi:hypothetical protein